MNKIALLIAGLALVTTTAQAQQIGNTLSFNRPNPVAVGCTEAKDAAYVKKLWRAHEYYEIRDFAEWVGVRPNGGRSCIVLNNSSNNKWKIVKREQPANGFAWYCLQGTIDLRTDDSNEPDDACFWIWLNDPPPVAKRPEPDTNKTLRDYNEWRRQQDARK
jgi:hypothetical protein